MQRRTNMDKVILAKGIILNKESKQHLPNDNQMIFGGTGSGKTTSVVLPTLLFYTFLQMMMFKSWQSRLLTAIQNINAQQNSIPGGEMQQNPY